MSEGKFLKKALGTVRRIPDIYLASLIVFILFSVLDPRFIRMRNIMLIARNSSILLVASLGMTMVILMSQIDLSIGSIMSLSGVIVVVSYGKGVPIVISLVIALILSMVLGLINGLLISKLKLDYWLVSFAMMGIVGSLALVLSDSRTLPLNNAFMSGLGSGKILGLSYVTVIALLLFAATAFMLGYTKLGSNIYSVGGSEGAAHLSGINVYRTRVTVYVLSGLFAGVAGILLTAMSASASPIAGAEYSFTTMAAVVIGGTSFSGGKGGLGGTIMGVFLLRILASGLNFLGLRASLQKAVIGFVIVFVLLFDAINMRRRRMQDQRRRYVDEQD